MKTIEEKAYSHVDGIFAEMVDKYQNAPWNEFRDALAQIYLAGARETLAGQWRKYPDEDFPDTGIEYIVLTESGDLCAVNKYAKKEEVKHYTNIIAWMPIHELKDESV